MAFVCQWAFKQSFIHSFIPYSGPLPLLKNNDKACDRRKRGGQRAYLSNPKRTIRFFRCMVSIDRSTHPHSFIRRGGCHASLGFPGRCQLLVVVGGGGGGGGGIVLLQILLLLLLLLLFELSPPIRMLFLYHVTACYMLIIPGPTQ